MAKGEKEAFRQIDAAARYYYLYVINALADGGFIATREIFAEVMSELDATQNTGPELVHRRFTLIVLRRFAKAGWAASTSDPYADEYIQSKAAAGAVAEADPEFKALLQKYHSLGDAGKDWLLSAVQRIGRNFDVAILDDYLKSLSPAEGSQGIAATPEAADASAVTPEPEWEPLKIDRQSVIVQEAINASEAALHEIEGSNGYATTAPEERNGVVNVIRGTLAAIREGSPSKQAIIQGLLQPLKFITKKFADTTMGEIAKLAVAKIIAWLIS
jgi:hypothetical protein